MTSSDNILILGSGGQIGTDLVHTLRTELGGDRVIAADVKDQEGYLKRVVRFINSTRWTHKPSQM